MTTRDDVKDGLHRAAQMIRPLDEPLQGFHRRRLARHRRRRLGAAALAMALTAGIVAISLAAINGVRVRDHDPRTGGLGRGAGVASSLELQPGQYFYLREVVFAGADRAWTDQRTWWGIDRSGELHFDTNRPDKYVPFPAAGVYGKGQFPDPWWTDGDSKSGKLDVSRLSTDPHKLLRQLRRLSAERAGQGGEDAGPVWRAALRLFGCPSTLPQLRAALFLVAANLPGVTRADGVHDPFGRPAIALELRNDGEGGHWEVFFDPATHQPMSESEAWGNHALHPLVAFQSAIVDARGAAPSGHELLFAPASLQLRIPAPRRQR